MRLLAAVANGLVYGIGYSEEHAIADACGGHATDLARSRLKTYPITIEQAKRIADASGLLAWPLKSTRT